MPEQIELANLPNIEIIKDGKKVNTSAIDDYDPFMSFLMLASIASNTAKVRRYHEDRTSIGKTQSFNLNVTPTRQELNCIHPSQSIHVVNDGPGQIFVDINALTGTPTPLFARDEMSVDFQTHKLLRFYVSSAPGTVATARAQVKY